MSAVNAALLDSLPFGVRAASNSLISKLPGSPSAQQLAQAQDAAERKSPVVAGVTKAIGGTAIGAGLGVLTEGVGGGLLGETAANGGASALLVPGYKLGDIANQAQLRGDPLRIEQIIHTLFSGQTAKEMLEAFGIGASASVIMGAAGKGEAALKGMAGRSAVRQSAPKYADAVKELRLPLGSEVDLAQLALEKKLYGNANRITALKEQAGAKLGTLAESLEPDEEFQLTLAKELDDLAEKNAYNPALRAGHRKLAQYSASLESNDLTGPEVHELAKALSSESRDAFSAGDSQLGHYYGDAAYIAHDSIADRLSLFDHEAGQSYKNAQADYRAYMHMEKPARALAKDQITVGDLATVGAAQVAAGAAFKANPELGMMVETGAGALGYSKLRGKSYVQLLDRYSKAPPFATFLKQTGGTMKALFGPANAAQLVEAQDSPEERYTALSKALEQTVVNPEGVAQQVRAKLNFLPQHEADAVTAQVVDKLQTAAVEMPQSKGPPTAFGQETEPSPRQKRAFIEKFDCKFDPYKALKSGSREMMIEAEKHCPETVQYMRRRITDEIAKREAAGNPVPYSTKRKLSAILGVAGVSMQDPALGAKLQHIIQTKRAAESQAGQMGSANQAKAAMKNDKATLSRAQGILNQEGQ